MDAVLTSKICFDGLAGSEHLARDVEDVDGDTVGVFNGSMCMEPRSAADVEDGEADAVADGGADQLAFELRTGKVFDYLVLSGNRVVFFFVGVSHGRGRWSVL